MLRRSAAHHPRTLLITSHAHCTPMDALMLVLSIAAVRNAIVRQFIPAR
jgi:hypothetical protein